MIHHQHKCIFVHITKTAGSSITKALGKSDVGSPHRNIFKYKSMLGDKKFNEYFKFAVVRNPWDRMVSEYHYQIQRKDGRNINMNFKDYLKIGHVSQVGNQLDWIASPKWRLKNNSNSFGMSGYDKKSDEVNLLVDKVLYFENIENGIKEVSDIIGVNIVLPKINTSKHNDYRTYYNEETRSMVYRSHERDIKYFNYEF